MVCASRDRFRTTRIALCEAPITAIVVRSVLEILCAKTDGLSAVSSASAEMLVIFTGRGDSVGDEPVQRIRRDVVTGCDEPLRSTDTVQVSVSDRLAALTRPVMGWTRGCLTSPSVSISSISAALPRSHPLSCSSLRNASTGFGDGVSFMISRNGLTASAKSMNSLVLVLLNSEDQVLGK